MIHLKTQSRVSHRKQNISYTYVLCECTRLSFGYVKAARDDSRCRQSFQTIKNGAAKASVKRFGVTRFCEHSEKKWYWFLCTTTTKLFSFVTTHLSSLPLYSKASPTLFRKGDRRLRSLWFLLYLYTHIHIYYFHEYIHVTYVYNSTHATHNI